MNHLYRLVFNHALKTVQVVSEIVRGGSKGRQGRAAPGLTPAMRLLVPALALACAGTAQAVPGPGWNEWRGGSIDWFTAGNWSGGVPTLNSVAAYVDGARYTEVNGGNAFSNHLHIGNASSGRLGVLNGGNLRTRTIFMAHDVGSSALAEIDGAGSVWRSDTTIGVGHGGTAQVVVTNQGHLDIGTDAYVGATPTGNGTVIANGDGARFSVGRTLLVGNEGTGQVRMEGGADMTSRGATVGSVAGANGTVQITGAGSTWTNSGSMLIGDRGTGTVEVLDGGLVDTSSAIWIGQQRSPTVRANGTLRVDGMGSSFIARDMVVVGSSGDGVINVTGGGRMTVANAATLGEQVGSTGRVTVSGAGSGWTSGSLRVGANADARFEVTNGALANVTGPVELALMATSTARLQIGRDAVLRVGNGTSGRIYNGAGNARIEMDGGTLMGNGALAVDANLLLTSRSTLQADSNMEVSGQVSGAGQLRKTGAGTLTLMAANLHTGGTQVDSGRLVLGHQNALGTGQLHLLGGTALGFGQNNLVVANAVTLRGAVAVDTASNSNATLTGTVGNGTSSGQLVKTGAGTLTLSGTNNYSGGTRVAAGRLAVTNGAALGSGTLQLADATTLAMSGGTHLANVVVLVGDTTLDVAAGSATLGGIVRDGAGSGVLTKVGTGSLTLGGANLYSGGTNIRSGAVLLGHDQAAGTGVVSMAGGTRLGFSQSGVTLANQLALQGMVTVTADSNQTALISGDVVDAASAGTLVKSGAGTLTLSGNNRYSGGTSVHQGTLRVESDGALGSGGLSMQGAGTLALSGTALSLGNAVTLSDTNRVVVWPGSATLAGVIEDGAHAGALVKSGAGRLVLANANTFSGGLVVENGLLLLGHDTAAGSGTLAMNEWTELGVTQAGLDIANAMTLQGDVRVNTGTGMDTGLSGVIGDGSSAGRLVKVGDGTLTLANANHYSGGTQVEGGTLDVAANGALGSGALHLADGTTLALSGSDLALGNAVTMAGTTTFDVASGSAVLNGVLSDGENISRPIFASVMAFAQPTGSAGTPSGTLVKQGAGTLVLGADNLYSGGTRIEAGRLRLQDTAAIGGNIAIAAGAGLDLDRVGDTRVVGMLSGAGEVIKHDAGQLWLHGDSSLFAGQTRVDAGSLVVQGALGGALTMADGTTLAGTGTLGDVTLLDGARLAPRMQGEIGTLRLTGDLRFAAGSQFLVDVDAAGSSDRMLVGGTATLGNAGTVALATGADWAPNSVYTLLTAEQGVQGTFSGVSSNLAFLDSTLSYDANNVYLRMARNDIALPDVAIAFPEVVVNANQLAVAGAVEALGAGNAVYDAVVRLEVPQVAPAFDSLGGEIHAAARTALLQDRFLQDGIAQRLDGKAISGGFGGTTQVWVAGSGNTMRLDADGLGTRSRVQQQGLMAGADWQVSEQVLVGVAAGEQTLTTRLDAHQAKADVDATEYGVYGQFKGDRLGLQAGVSRTDYRIDSAREVVVGTRFTQSLASRSDAEATRVFARAGWDFDMATLTLTPEIELAHVRLRSEQAVEGGGSSALQVQANRDELSTGLAALRAVWDISGGERDRAALTARVGWQYAQGDLGAATRARFVAGDSTFAMQSVPLARRMGVAQVGVAVSPTAASRLSLQAQARAGEGQRDAGVQLNWSVQF